MDQNEHDQPFTHVDGHVFARHVLEVNVNVCWLDSQLSMNIVVPLLIEFLVIHFRLLYVRELHHE